MTDNQFQLSFSARRVLISLNPKAGAKSGLPAVQEPAELLKQRDFLVETLTDINELSSKAAIALENGELRCVVSA